MNQPNALRFCGHARYLFTYWLTYVHGFDKLNKEQIIYITTLVKDMSLWLITTCGYFDKSVKGNWTSWNTWIQPTDMPNGKIEYIDANEVVNSECFLNFYNALFNLLMNRNNDFVILAIHFDDCFPLRLFKKEHDLFVEHITLNCNKESIVDVKQLLFKSLCLNPTTLFTRYANKNVVFINLYADLIRDHYNSGKVRDWYIKQKEIKPNNVIPSFNNVSSIEIPYPFGNGMNETECNDFFEMLDKIKLKIDNHSEPYHLAIISAGIYTPFIADYIDKIKGKEFTCYGRELNHIFCIKYKHTYRWCHCEFTKTHLEEYLCPIPDKYRLTGFQGVEEGGYW